MVRLTRKASPTTRSARRSATSGSGSARSVSASRPMAPMGVFSSWLRLATKSRRMASTRRASVTSSVTTRAPPGRGRARHLDHPAGRAEEVEARARRPRPRRAPASSSSTTPADEGGTVAGAGVVGGRPGCGATTRPAASTTTTPWGRVSRACWTRGRGGLDRRRPLHGLVAGPLQGPDAGGLADEGLVAPGQHDHGHEQGQGHDGQDGGHLRPSPRWPGGGGAGPPRGAGRGRPRRAATRPGPTPPRQVTATYPAPTRAVSESGGSSTAVSTRVSDSRPGPLGSRVERTVPKGASEAHRVPRTASRSTAGTLTLSTVRVGAVTAQPRAATPTAAAVSKRGPGVDPDADGHPGDAQVGAGQGGAHGARVEHRPAGVVAGVDPGDHDVGRLAEAAEAGRQHAEGGGPGQAPRRDVLGAGDAGLGDAEVGVAAHVAQGGGVAAVVAVGRGDEHLVAGRVEGTGEGVQPGGVDAVVVGDQDPHVSPPRGRPRRAGSRPPAGAAPPRAPPRSARGATP